MRTFRVANCGQSSTFSESWLRLPATHNGGKHIDLKPCVPLWLVRRRSHNSLNS